MYKLFENESLQVLPTSLKSNKAVITWCATQGWILGPWLGPLLRVVLLLLTLQLLSVPLLWEALQSVSIAVEHGLQSFIPFVNLHPYPLLLLMGLIWYRGGRVLTAAVCTLHLFHPQSPFQNLTLFIGPLIFHVEFFPWSLIEAISLFSFNFHTGHLGSFRFLLVK